MKRLLTTMILALLASCLFAYDYAQPILGYVGSTADLTFELDEAVLPVNLDSSEILRTPGDSPRGKRIGRWSFITNMANFKLYINHTKLELVGSSNVSGMQTSIDYRLYLFTSQTIGTTTTTSYDSCMSSEYTNPAEETNTTKLITLTGDSCSIVNQSVYVNLEDNDPSRTGLETTKNVVDALSKGTYNSTIYFYLESNS